MVFGNGVKNIQATAYNGAHMVVLLDLGLTLVLEIAQKSCVELF